MLSCGKSKAKPLDLPALWQLNNAARQTKSTAGMLKPERTLINTNQHGDTQWKTCIQQKTCILDTPTRTMLLS